jgi:pimeloyl-ACP methyl ester carboxylesterase
MARNERFWERGAIRQSRRGNFWLAGDRVTVDDMQYQHGAMFVSWEAPPSPVKTIPVVLVHGGAVQGTEWLDTPDGRPGWAQRFVEAGYPVFVVDRPTQGRSPYHPAVSGPMGPPFSYAEGRTVFFPPDRSHEHTQWPFDVDDDAALDAFISAFGPLPADLAESQRLDGDRLADLLDLIGPAVIVTHSASGPSGWMVADRRPDLVRAIVSVEPMGPPFATIPHIGRLAWGLTAARLTYDPSFSTTEQVAAADPQTVRVPALKDLPVAIVTGGASPFAKAGRDVATWLRTAGASADLLDLPSFGVHGNGHGLIYERNSDETLQPVLTWLETRLP